MFRKIVHQTEPGAAAELPGRTLYWEFGKPVGDPNSTIIGEEDAGEGFGDGADFAFHLRLLRFTLRHRSPTWKSPAASFLSPLPSETSVTSLSAPWRS